MTFNPTTCQDCSYPPNFIVLELKDENRRPFYSIKCRDCGDIWDEPGEIFSGIDDPSGDVEDGLYE